MASVKRVLFKIYVVGKGAKNNCTINNFTKACKDSLLPGTYEIQVINLLKNIDEAEKKNILGTPLIIKERPLPEKRVIGEIPHPNKGTEALNYLMEEY
jgi:circadian clock protein KaiB